MIGRTEFESMCWRLFLLPLFGFSLLLVAGCGGCTEQDPEAVAEREKEEEQRKKEQEKPNYESKPPVIFPGNYVNEQRTNRTKRGHWITADLRIIANKFNAQGELTGETYNPKERRAGRVPQTSYFLKTSRPVSLPKEEWRNLEADVYIPENPDLKNTLLDFRLYSGAGSLPQAQMQFGAAAMLSHQYHMIVLTNRPDAYAYVNVLDAVRMPDVIYSSGERYPPFYNVVRTRPSQDPIPLPRDALTMTTIAYIIWDDLEADQLDEDQQAALIDWLHFGGQLIMSGPDCLDRLKNSFLADYLPAQFDGARNLTDEDFEQINEHWAVPVKNNAELKHKLQINKQSPLLGVKFIAHPDASFVNQTGDVVIERRIGRGRIAITAFSMDEQPMIAWSSFRSFFNGGLLRRPGRVFGKTMDDTLSFAWINDNTSVIDPMLGSTLRFVSRDLNDGGTDPDARMLLESKVVQPTPFFGQPAIPQEIDVLKIEGHNYGKDRRDLNDQWHYGGFQHREQAGVAGWNDYGSISNAARETLREAAGITPPSKQFVFQMLAIYLIVLVPVNWAFFRLLGRVEWAWVAAPIIAIAGAVVVAKMASLDIGFVRSNSQVALLEVYAGHDRGHLTQYSALYTSLSTGYNLDLDNPSAQSLPFGSRPGAFQPTESLSEVTMRRTLTKRLEGFSVQSNSTGMLHSELMLDIRGAWNHGQADNGRMFLENGSAVAVRDAAVIRRQADGTYQICWIGELNSGDRIEELQFQTVDQADPQAALRKVWLDQNRQFQSTRYISETMWRSIAGEAESVETIQFQAVPEINERWSVFLQNLRRVHTPLPGEDIELSMINQSEFEAAFMTFYERPGINVSRLFEEVLENLQIAKGESRLIGVTDQSLGNNQFDPASTRTEQETLVLVHLARPAFPEARPDANLLSDLGQTKTSLDWEEDFDPLQSEQTIDAEQSDDQSDEEGDGSEGTNEDGADQ